MRCRMAAVLALVLVLAAGGFPQGIGDSSEGWIDFGSCQSSTQFPPWGRASPPPPGPTCSDPCLDEVAASRHMILVWVTVSETSWVQFFYREYLSGDKWAWSPWQGISAGDDVPCDGRYVLQVTTNRAINPGITVEVQMRAKGENGKIGAILECGTVVLDGTLHGTCGAYDCLAVWTEPDP